MFLIFSHHLISPSLHVRPVQLDGASCLADGFCTSGHCIRYECVGECCENGRVAVDGTSCFNVFSTFLLLVHFYFLTLTSFFLYCSFSFIFFIWSRSHPFSFTFRYATILYFTRFCWCQYAYFYSLIFLPHCNSLLFNINSLISQNWLVFFPLFFLFLLCVFV